MRLRGILPRKRFLFARLWDKLELLTKCLKYRDAGDFKQEKRCLSASH
jgi:hypothetical protein